MQHRGGGTDIVARGLALEMANQMGRSFIVENRPGAAGNIAALAVARSAPDGNTLLLSYTSHAINATLYPALPFDPVKDFTPICGVASLPAILVARPTLKANNVRELIALARVGTGQAQHRDRRHRQRQPPGRRDAQAPGRHRHRQRAVQGAPRRR